MDVNARNNSGETALHIAVIERKAEFVDELLRLIFFLKINISFPFIVSSFSSAGADPTIEDDEKMSPLKLSKGNQEIIEIFTSFAEKRTK